MNSLFILFVGWVSIVRCSISDFSTFSTFVFLKLSHIPCDGGRFGNGVEMQGTLFIGVVFILHDGPSVFSLLVIKSFFLNKKLIMHD